MAKKANKKTNKQSSTGENILGNIENSVEGGSVFQSSGPACTNTPVKIKTTKPLHKALNLSKEEMMRALKFMFYARKSDDKHLTLVKQGKSFFHIGGSGHEATQVAVAMTLEPGKDWAWTYYRDIAFTYTMGMTPKEYFLLAAGKPECPASGGHQMPGHFGNPRLNMPTQSSTTGTQFLNAVGTALASRKLKTDEITYVASGEGTTSQGEFYEAVNWASREKLPVLFHIQDNKYAISVPREKQSMGSNVGHTFCCYSNLKMKTYDGTDFFISLAAAREAVDYMRVGKGPVLLHAMVERLLPHSSSDDHRKYRSAEELKKMKEEGDGIKKFKEYLIDNNIASIEEIENLEAAVKKEIDDAADWAYDRPDPLPEDATKHVFADESTRNLPYTDYIPTEGKKVVMVDAIKRALKEEMERNPKMLIFGEDVADPKGGVFTATKGLTDLFGEERVFNSPLAEASIAGVALGLAVRKFKPVVEIQFGDYIWPAFMQIRDEISTMRFRSNNGFAAPVVIRTAVGGYIHGGLYHSQNIEAFFTHIPGLLIAYPSTAADAKGLLKTACRLEDPVLFLEHKGLYRLPYSTSFESEEDYLIPFGKGKIVKHGDDLTVVTYGMMVRDSLNAAKKIEKETGKTIEIIDLRTLIPWDKELVIDSVRKTNRVMVIHEDTKTSGFGAEIAAEIAASAFDFLDAPVRRHAALDSHIPYHPIYEEAVLPNEKKIKMDIEQLLNF
jgi:2-oxoisovalerate dehydrogenase E1 component